jgi:hypothetical protein
MSELGDAMSELIMDFYDYRTGALFTLRWRNEEEYRQGKAFLAELLGPEGSVGVDEPGRVPSYYLETEQQFDALLDFRHKLREAAKT